MSIVIFFFADKLVKIMTEKTVEVAPGALVCKEAILEGRIKIGSGTIVHPTATIRAKNGPIVIGENNNIEETVLIENVSPDGKTMEIGAQNIFEIGSVIQAAKIGNGNLFGVQCKVGPSTEVTNNCFIGVRCSALLKEELPENTVIYGKGNSRRIAERSVEGQMAQLDFLRKLIPSFHYVQKT